MLEPKKAIAEYTLKGLTKLASDGDYSTLESMGLTRDIAQRLVRLTLGELEQLLSLCQVGNLVSVAINSRSLEQLLHRIDEYARLDQLQDEFLIKGASAVMMRKLFGLQDDFITNRKQILGLRSPIGRPHRPPETVLLHILNRWDDLARQPAFADERQRFLQLAEETGESLAALWNVIERKHELKERLEPLTSHVPLRRVERSRSPVQGLRQRFIQAFEQP